MGNVFMVFILAMQAGLAWVGEPPTRFGMCTAAATGAVGWLLLWAET